MTNNDTDARDSIFAKEQLSWQQLQFIKRNVSAEHFVNWLRENYDYLMCYHAGRPVDVNSYYINGFVPADFKKSVERFEELLHTIPYRQPYDIQHVLDDYKGQTDRFIYFILDKEDFIGSAPHYLIYGSELLLSLAQNVASFIKEYLKNIGIPTIFHCKIPLDQIDDFELKGLHERIRCANGGLNARRNQIFSNYSIIIEQQVSGAYIIGHDHPTVLLTDYHAYGSYKNNVAFCSVCTPVT